MPAPDLNRVRISKTVTHTGDFLSVAREPNSEQLWIRHTDFKIYPLDFAAERPQATAVVEGHHSYVAALRLIGGMLVSASWDRKLMWWDFTEPAVDANAPASMAACNSTPVTDDAMSADASQMTDSSGGTDGSNWQIHSRTLSPAPVMLDANINQGTPEATQCVTCARDRRSLPAGAGDPLHRTRRTIAANGLPHRRNHRVDDAHALRYRTLLLQARNAGASNTQGVLFVGQQTSTDFFFPLSDGSSYGRWRSGGTRTRANAMVKLEIHAVNFTPDAIAVAPTVTLDSIDLPTNAVAADMQLIGTEQISVPPHAMGATTPFFKTIAGNLSVFGLETQQHRFGTEVQVGYGPERNPDHPGLGYHRLVERPDDRAYGAATFTGSTLGATGLQYSCKWDNTSSAIDRGFPGR